MPVIVVDNNLYYLNNKGNIEYHRTIEGNVTSLFSTVAGNYIGVACILDDDSVFLGLFDIKISSNAYIPVTAIITDIPTRYCILEIDTRNFSLSFGLLGGTELALNTLSSHGTIGDYQHINYNGGSLRSMIFYHNPTKVRIVTEPDGICYDVAFTVLIDITSEKVSPFSFTTTVDNDLFSGQALIDGGVIKRVIRGHNICYYLKTDKKLYRYVFGRLSQLRENVTNFQVWDNLILMTIDDETRLFREYYPNDIDGELMFPKGSKVIFSCASPIDIPIKRSTKSAKLSVLA